jgi:hypothetical protein
VTIHARENKSANKETKILTQIVKTLKRFFTEQIVSFFGLQTKLFLGKQTLMDRVQF